jgi:CRISPR-associated protein Csx14
MNRPHSTITLDVDLRNPGQFFACCGVLELASRLWPGSEGWFEGAHRQAVFHVSTPAGDADPIREIVRLLCETELLVTLPDDHVAYAQADRKPVTLEVFGLRLDWWLDSYRGGDKSELKVWAGQQTPERNLNGLRHAWRPMLADANASWTTLFTWRCPMTGRFGFDPSASWDALDVGFSPDEQTLPVQTSPATEILAAIGLQRCRPVPTRKKGRWFGWRAWSDPFEIAVVPAAVVGAGAAIGACEFPVVMRNAQYGNFGWARPWRNNDEHME